MNRGEQNPQAQLTDDEVEQIRALRESEEGQPRSKRYWTYARLAEKFEVSRKHIHNILSYRQRVLTADDQ